MSNKIETPEATLARLQGMLKSIEAEAEANPGAVIPLQAFITSMGGALAIIEACVEERINAEETEA